MGLLDLRTVVSSHLATGLMCALVIASLWRQHRHRYQGLSFWLADAVLQLLAAALLALRGQMPDWMSMVLANTLLMTGAFLGYVGLERFVGQTSRQWHNFMLLALFVGVHSYFGLRQPNLAARDLNLSVGLFLLCFQCLWLLLRRVKPELRPITRGVGLIFGGFCLVSLARVTLLLVNPPTTNDYFASGLAEALALLAYQLLAILLTFGLALLVNGRLRLGLQSLSSRQEALLAAVPDIIMEVDHRKVYTWANQAGLDFFGDDVMGKEAAFYFAGDQATYQSVQPLFDGQQDLIYVESWQRRKDGEKRLLAWCCRVLKDEGGKATGALSSARDMTEQRQAEQWLRESETKYRTLVENIPQKIFIKDRDLRWVSVNENFARDLGLRSEELAGRSDHDFYPRELADKYRADDARVMQTGQAEELEEKHLHGGREIWVRTVKTPVRDQQGNITGVFGIFSDITERKRTEEALRESEARTRSLNRRLEALQEAFARLAVAHNLAEIMVVARSAARRLTEADGATFVLRDGQYCHYADEEAIAPLWKGQRFPMDKCISGWVMLNNQPAVITDIYADARIPADAYRATFVKSLAMVPIRTADTLGAIGNYWAQPHDTTPEELRLLTALADGVAVAMENVHSYRLLEQRVQERTAALEAANQELESFSYSVSHDLRAPLRAIDGFANILLAERRERLDAEGHRLLGIVCGEAKRMGRLIDDLLAFSRMSRQAMKSESVDLGALAQAAYEECAAQAPGRQIGFNLLPLPPAHGDPSLLRQVLVNLLGNAIKYTRPRPVAKIEMGGRAEGAESVYYVQDNGVGFDMKYAQKLFGVFQRLHSEDQFEGTGVGLAIVQRVVLRHGGRVWAEGQVNQGARFHFALPRKTEPHES
jgi:PAS domain S-box-containing protein